MSPEELAKRFVSWSAGTSPKYLVSCCLMAFLIVTFGYFLITSDKGYKGISKTPTAHIENTNVQVDRSLLNIASDAISNSLNPAPVGESTSSEKISVVPKQKTSDSIKPVTDADIVNSAQNQQEVLTQRIRELSGKIAEIESSFEGTNSKLVQLKTSSEGRKIASDQRLLEGLFLLIDGMPDSKEQVLPLKDELSILKSAFIASISTNDFPKLRDSISALTKKSSELAIKAESLRKSVANFVQMGAANAENASTVQQLMDQRDFQLTMQAAADAEAVRKKAREKIAEADRRAVEAEAKLRQSEREAKIAADNLVTERNQLERDFQNDLVEIQSLLSPFITPANSTYTHNGHNGYFHPSTPGKQPLSLGAIQNSGALESRPEGFEMLIRITSHDMLVRPLGSFPRTAGTEWKQNVSAKTRMERAQTLLRKYGKLLVEKNLLEP